ncbi:hypothetical protein TL16_g02730 [Triparma laevis f. inornata]|uniref:Uncharacterized protein n=1 Tax=Triparma laevis f. inornata TaxID=1714386 RepID=A0A9W6ZX51_9STRA|nr:hypothetical protein TL16_g02730 [Triparma laevis f. inornata]
MFRIAYGDEAVPKGYRRSAFLFIFPWKFVSRWLSFEEGLEGWAFWLGCAYSFIQYAVTFVFLTIRNWEKISENPLMDKRRLYFLFVLGILGAMATGGLVVFSPTGIAILSVVIAVFCFGTGLTLLYFDSMTQKRTGHQFNGEISYVIIASYTTSACLFITGPMTLSTLRYVKSAELLTALIIKGVLLVSFVCFKIVFRRAMPADKVDLYFDVVFLDTSLGSFEFWIVLLLDCSGSAIRHSASLRGWLAQKGLVGWRKRCFDKVIDFFFNQEIDIEVSDKEGGEGGVSVNRTADRILSREITSYLSFASSISSPLVILCILFVESMYCIVRGDVQCKRFLTVGVSNAERWEAAWLYIILIIAQILTWILSAIRDKREVGEEVKAVMESKGFRERSRRLLKEHEVFIGATVCLAVVFLVSAAQKHRKIMEEEG